ncbi:hypothetical protein Egran_04595 [Elaphomyces granulatus]|uniref:5-formyltetrahydrofolate cyclo-ligase n=1 Tax=Elaphomyces granulatus TaxID=519963 RepID=A0A232LTZ9_9EURO|nr:hypothetical protein Egran_04595 [Elaphomyces granulatus]
MMTNPLQVAKKDMRRRIRNILLEVPREGVISQSALATTKLFSLAEYRNAKRISVYLSMPHSEIATRGIVQDALKSGKEVFIPHIHRVDGASMQSNVSVMDMLSLNSLEEFESLNLDKWGIPTLSDDNIPNKLNCFGGYGVSAGSTKTPGDGAGLDLIVMPGMAFDADLRRLGHGKGYYDNFLSRYWKEMERSTGAPRMPFLGEIFYTC